jgi:hydroxymethylpyrimidine pyrophosphatase-like HAD family hydrolase
MVSEKMPDVGAEIHAGTNVLTLNRTAESDLHQKYEELPTNCVDFNTAYGYNWNKVVYMLDNENQYKEIIPFLEKNAPECSLLKTSAAIKGIKRNYFEQVPKGISKLTALNKLCEIINIEKGKLFAIGDYYNDLEMIKNADISGVTADTPDDIKQYAKFIGGSCKDGAVADFIEYLIEVKNRKDEKYGS